MTDNNDAQHPGSSADQPPYPAASGNEARRSGFEKANRALDGASRAANATGSFILKLYGVVLILFGIVGVFAIPDAWWSGIPAVLYGIYLLWPGGSKVVIY